jgi:hypothetical protein
MAETATTPAATEPNPLIEKPATEEKPPEKPVEEAKPKESAAQRFALAAKREKKAQEERAALKAEREKLDAERKELERMRLRPEEYTRKPLQVLADAFPGVDPARAFKMLSDAILNDGKPTADFGVQEVRGELGSLKQQIADLAKSREEERQKAEEEQRQKATAGFQAEIDSFLKTNADAYELTNLYGQSKLVFATIQEHFDRTEEEMSIRDAAEKVEKYLEAEAEKALKAKKFAGKLKPPAEAAPTLGSETPSPGPTKPLSFEERRKRAEALLAEKYGA